MFKREHHKLVAEILEALDAEALREHGCYFGGGTAMTMRYGEYRKSMDIDFMVSDEAGYRWIRQALGDVQGLTAISKKGTQLETARDFRTTPYSVSTKVLAGATKLKFEVVREARIKLDAPGPQDTICGIPCLTPIDMAAEKLLANVDRGLDTAFYNRDVIDLAMQNLGARDLQAACAKAEGEYHGAVRTSLHKSIARLQNHTWAETCLRALAVTDVSPAQLLQRLKKLERALPSLSPEDRNTEEPASRDHPRG